MDNAGKMAVNSKENTEIWTRFLTEVEKRTDPHIFENWIEPLGLISYIDNRMEIEVPNTFYRSWIEANFLEIIRETLIEITGNEVNIVFTISEKQVKKKTDKLELSEEKELELGMKLSKHLLFIRFFKGQGQWHYAGNGVKLGQADKAIFWYQPQGSETWRVIYGDLSVKDVSAEELPE